MVVVVGGGHDFPIMDSIRKWLSTENRGDRSKEREVFALGAPEWEEIAPGVPSRSGQADSFILRSTSPAAIGFARSFPSRKSLMILSISLEASGVI